MRSDPTFALVLDTALDSVVVMDGAGNVLEWNHQAEELFGFSRDEVMGQEMASFIIPHRYRQAHHGGLKRYLAGGEGPVLRKRIEISALNKAGEEFPVELSISPATHNGEPIFIGFLRDIRARIASEKLLAEQAREALLLQRLTSLAAESASLDEALYHCLKSICDLLGWPIGHAFLGNGVKGQPLISSVWVGETERFSALQAATEDTVFRAEEGLPGRVLASAEVTWIPDVRQAGHFMRNRAGDLGVRAALTIPVTVAGEVVAVLEFFDAQIRPVAENVMLTARAMADQLGRVLERQSDQQHQKLLLGELEHRSKNMLAIVMGIASQTAKSAASLERFMPDYLGRLASLSRTYGLLTAQNWQSASLQSLVSSVIEPHISSSEQLVFESAEVLFPAKAALSMSLVLHELTTNAAKYGALYHKGHIRLSASIETTDKDSVLHLNWLEDGVPDLAQSPHQGFGSKLIGSTIKNELKGVLDVRYHRSGIEYNIELPL